MHAGRIEPRQRARTPHRVRLKVEQADAIALKHDLTTNEQKAAWFGVADTTYSRVVRGVIHPGEEFIAAVLGSHPDDPDITFDSMFEVVAA